MICDRQSISGDNGNPEDYQREQDQQDADQHFDAGHRSAGNRVEAEQAGDRSDDQQNDDPFDRVKSPALAGEECASAGAVPSGDSTR